MHIYMYTYTFVCLNVYSYVYILIIHVFSVSVCVCVSVCLNVYIYVHMYIYIYICIHVYVCIHVCIYVYINMSHAPDLNHSRLRLGSLTSKLTWSHMNEPFPWNSQRVSQSLPPTDTPATERGIICPGWHIPEGTHPYVQPIWTS